MPTVRLPARTDAAPPAPRSTRSRAVRRWPGARPKPDYAPELPSIAAVRNDLPADDAEAPPAEVPLRRLGKKAPAKPARAKKPSGAGGPGKPLLLGGVLVLAAAVAGAIWFLRPPGAATPGSAPAATAADDGPPGAPRIASLEPEAALPGRELVLNGANLAGADVKITIGGVEAKPIESTPTRVRLVVPKLPIVVEGQPVAVVVQAGGVRSRPIDLFLGRLPLVSEITPRAGVPGDLVVVKGRGFDPTPAGNRVSFGDDAALVVTASGNELSVIVPAPKSSLNRVDAAVVVQRGSASSAADSVIFNITRPAAGVYKLRFFGAAVEGDATGEQAFVSTEVGPLLLLSGRGAQESVGARATAVAAALNALVGQAPRFEVRTGFAIGAAGRLDPVVVTTPLDAAAYGKPLDPVMEGQASQATPTVVARFWVALLQDAFTLLEKGARPDRVLELSPRGKVLMDLYSDSERKIGAGVGVPTNLVSPPTWTIAKGMREMALALPRGGAVAAAAIVGSWSGTLEETGAVAAQRPPAAATRGQPAGRNHDHERRGDRHERAARRREVRGRAAELHARRRAEPAAFPGTRERHPARRHHPGRRRRPHGADQPALPRVTARRAAPRVAQRPAGAARAPRRRAGTAPGARLQPHVGDARPRPRVGGAPRARGRSVWCALFGPEHGIWADAQDLVEVEDSRDPRDGPARATASTAARACPPRRCCTGVDALVFDVQDVGSRYYTFIYTMLHAMEACAAHGRRLVVLDRPNPLGRRDRRRQPARPAVPSRSWACTRCPCGTA